MKKHVLNNARLWIGDGRAFDGHVVIENRRIAAVEPGPYRGDWPVTDLEGAPLSPGMIDLMVVGALGHSILRDDPLDLARDYLRLGVTSCQLTIGTLPWDAMRHVADHTQKAMGYNERDAARVLGLYLEGPFQHPDFTGASMREHALPPTAENVQRVLDELGPAVTMVNVSPKTEGDAEAVRRFCEAGKVVSMAHSDGSAERVFRCVEAGTSVLGHAWDNNFGLLGGETKLQQPTLEHVALTDDRVRFIHVICDGIHVDPVIVRLILRCRGVEAICLVTDSVNRAGCPDGPYHHDDGRLFIKKGGIGYTDAGWVCGSALLLPDHLRNFVKFTGTPPEQAICTVTSNPARSLGLLDTIGMITPDQTADLVAWDNHLRVRRVWRAGQEVNSISDYAEVNL